MKRIWNLLGIVLLLVSLAGCGEKTLTLDKVAQLSQKGEALSWEDFACYPCQEVGHGLYIRRYPIDETYDLLIGGTNPEEAPWYIYLRKTEQEHYIDIRTGDVAAFIRETREA